MTRLQVNALVILVASMFGFGFVVTKSLLFHMEPRLVIFFRVAISSLIFLPWVFLHWPKKIEPRDWIRLVIVAISGVTANQLLFAIGLKHTTAGHSSIINSGIPVFTFFIATCFGYERLKLSKLIGLLLSFLGLAYLIKIEKLNWSNQTLFGDALTFLNMLSFSFYLVVARPLSKKYPLPWITAMIFLIGIATITPFSFSPLLSFHAAQVPWVAWAGLAYMIVAMTIGNYGLITVLLRHTDSSHIAQGVYLQPIIAIFAAMLILGEPLSSRLLISTILVLLGVLLTQIKK